MIHKRPREYADITVEYLQQEKAKILDADLRKATQFNNAIRTKPKL